MTRTGCSNRCKECTSVYSTSARGRASRRAYQLRYTYGLTTEKYEGRIVEQGNKCACCGDGLGVNPMVDHDHVTGVVRGILCSGCNTGLGQIGDQAEGAHRAETYLWKSRDLVAEFAAGRHSVEEMIGASYV
ncbi:endonuclease VII domain-containing protein [Rhodococcus jostii]